MPDDPRAPGSAPPCAGSRMTTANVFCGGAVGSAVGCGGVGRVCCGTGGVEVCGTGCPGAGGGCGHGAFGENAWATAIIHTKNKQIGLLGTPPRIPESFQS